MSRRQFAEVENNPYRLDRKFRVCFESDEVERAFTRLQEHACPVCLEDDDKHVAFRTFKQLDTHVRREHERFFCDLCVEHLKVS